MFKTAPCYSRQNYYKYFDVNLTDKAILDIGSSLGSFKKSMKFATLQTGLGGAKKYITLDIEPSSRADIIADAHQLPLKDNSIDLIIANNVIEHLHDPQTALAEMKRVLVPGGHVYFTVPFLYPIHEAPRDFARFTKFGLQKLFSDFRNLEIYARGGWFSTTALFFYKMSHLLDKLYLGSIVRVAMYGPLWLWVQLDHFDRSDAFVRAYFGRAQK